MNSVSTVTKSDLASRAQIGGAAVVVISGCIFIVLFCMARSAAGG
jgi:hypothetical protein